MRIHEECGTGWPKHAQCCDGRGVGYGEVSQRRIVPTRVRYFSRRVWAPWAGPEWGPKNCRPGSNSRTPEYLPNPANGGPIGGQIPIWGNPMFLQSLVKLFGPTNPTRTPRGTLQLEYLDGPWVS